MSQGVECDHGRSACDAEPKVRIENLEVRNERVPPDDDAASAPGLDAQHAADGLARLVLAVMKALSELLERQAIRRMDEGELTDLQMERLGTALMRQSEEIERLRKEFGFTDEDLNLDLGPLGRLR